MAMLDAPFHRGSVSGKCRPMSPRATAPRIASVMACASTSASEWPASPFSDGTVTPPRMSGRPSTSRCRSYPVPTRMAAPHAAPPTTASAAFKSVMVVIFTFAGSPCTIRTRKPAASARAASSVATAPAVPASMAAASTLMLNA